MFIRYLDFLSPRVTFYHKGFLSHNSIPSGVLSIFSITCILILAVYFLLEIIEKKDPNAFYFNTFTEDTGVFQINTTSLFHFLTNVKNEQGNFYFEDFDFTAFNIIGTNAHYENYLGLTKSVGKDIGLKHLTHWLYGFCNKEKNTEGLDDLITYDFFERSACIKKYYSVKDSRYYDIGDKNFVWPEIAHGTFNEKSILYNIIIQKCENEVLKDILGEGHYCKNETEMNEVFNFRGARIIYLYFVNNYINILNYSNPNFKFFYRIENPLYEYQYSSNNLNFNPALIKTHYGLVWDDVKDEVSYILNRNDVYTGKYSDKDAYLVYGFYLKNIVEYYERSYKKLQDVISNIGGINQAVTIIAIYINSLYHHFVVLCDTEILLHSSITIEKKNTKAKIHKNLKLKKIKDLEKQQKIDNSESKESSAQFNFKRNLRETSNKKDIDYNLKDASKSINNYIDKDIYGDKKKNIEESNIKIDNNKEETKKKSKKTFCDYICFRASCGKKKDLFKVYENFRIKIISEEHLIRNHLNIYNLLKINEKKKSYRRNSYQLKDLINLI